MSVNSKKDWFSFKIVYFKPNGKYYTETVVNYEIRSINGDPYMPDVIAKIRGLRDSGSSLPGLSTSNWDGYIWVDEAGEGNVPHLILPLSKDI